MPPSSTECMSSRLGLWAPLYRREGYLITPNAYSPTALPPALLCTVYVSTITLAAFHLFVIHHSSFDTHFFETHHQRQLWVLFASTTWNAVLWTYSISESLGRGLGGLQGPKRDVAKGRGPKGGPHSIHAILIASHC